tara:strand:- start:1687 stop:2166 length:480 start_codon:yes stop_codon:yes gene_type:complete
MSVRKEFTKLLYEEMSVNEKVVLILGDLGYGHFNQHRIDFPNRVFNPLAAEQLMVGMAVGMALEGLIPICYSITPFVIFRPFEIVRNFIDHEKIPVKLVGSGRDKDYDSLGFSHWAIDDKKHLSGFKNIKKTWPEFFTIEKEFKDFINSPKPYYMNLSK